MGWHCPDRFHVPPRINKTEAYMREFGFGDRSIVELPGCPRGLLGVLNENRISKRVFSLVWTLCGDGTKAKKGGGAEWAPCFIMWTVSHYGSREVLGVRPWSPRPGGVQAKLTQKYSLAFIDFSVFSQPLGWGQRKKTTTCFFINDAFCR